MSHTLSIQTAGAQLQSDSKVLIMLHGRGSNSTDVLRFARQLNVEKFTLLAPQATQNSWYPYSFIAPREDNEPWLSSALQIVNETVKIVVDAGVPHENIYFFGFSQGACLTLEFLARHVHRYGGAVAIIGGLIGERLDTADYQGDLQQTPILLATSNPDPHVPLARVKETARILQRMNAEVTGRVFENFGHSINEEEIDLANSLIFNRE